MGFTTQVRRLQPPNSTDSPPKIRVYDKTEVGSFQVAVPADRERFPERDAHFDHHRPWGRRAERGIRHPIAKPPKGF